MNQINVDSLKLVHIGDPILREKCKAISDFTEARAIAERMTEMLRELNGAGLAAPQVGVALQLAIIEVRKTSVFPDRPESPLYVLINPEIIKCSSEKETNWEGCLSVPGLMGQVPRHASITVRYQNSAGEELEEEFKGYLARVVQHEIDHLQGIFYLDRMEDMQSLTTVENYKRQV